jgi:hypothetical protein
VKTGEVDKAEEVFDVILPTDHAATKLCIHANRRSTFHLRVYLFNRYASRRCSYPVGMGLRNLQLERRMRLKTYHFAPPVEFRNEV